MLWSAQRRSVPAIAEIVFTSEDRVREVILNLNAARFDSLAPKCSCGWPAKFTLPERREIERSGLRSEEEPDPRALRHRGRPSGAGVWGSVGGDLHGRVERLRQLAASPALRDQLGETGDPRAERQLSITAMDRRSASTTSGCHLAVTWPSPAAQR